MGEFRWCRWKRQDRDVTQEVSHSLDATHFVSHSMHSFCTLQIFILLHEHRDIQNVLPVAAGCYGGIPF
jgi:hypothetical protein